MGMNAGQWTEGGKLFGTAAVSNTLLKGKSGCGKCYELEVTAKCGNPYHKGGCNGNANTAAAGKRITVMATNLCPDLPACPKQPGQTNIYGKTVHFDICWHENKLGSMDNAMLKYREVPCPSAITKHLECTGGIGVDSSSGAGTDEAEDELDDLDEVQGQNPRMVLKVMPSSNHRCKGKQLKSLGQGMTADECAEKCRLDHSCKFALYQVGKTQKCISFEKCDAIRNPNTWKVFEKVAGDGTRTENGRSEPLSKFETTPSPKPTITEETRTQASDAATKEIIRAWLTLFAENFRTAEDAFIESIEESLAVQLGVDKTWVQVTDFEQSSSRRLKTAFPRRLAKTKITVRFEVAPVLREVAEIVANLEAPGFARNFTNQLVAVENSKGSTVVIEGVVVSTPEVDTVALDKTTTQMSKEESATQVPVTTASEGSTTTLGITEKISTSIMPSNTVSPASEEKTGTRTPVHNKTGVVVAALESAGINETEALDFLSTDCGISPRVAVPILLMLLSITAA